MGSWGRTDANIVNFDGKNIKIIVGKQFSFKRHVYRQLRYTFLKFHGLAEGAWGRTEVKKVNFDGKSL